MASNFRLNGFNLQLNVFFTQKVWTIQDYEKKTGLLIQIRDYLIKNKNSFKSIFPNPINISAMLKVF